MKELKDALSEGTVEALRAELEAGHFPGINFQQAMEFALTNGVLPAGDLPADSFLKLEDWLRERLSP